MDAAIPADAQNAPTGIWKSRTEREIPTAPTPIIVVVNERKNNGDSNSVAKPSTESDQAQLAAFFIKRFSGELKKKAAVLEPEALKLMMRYQWPGNIRELENTIERAMLLADGTRISAADLRLGDTATSISPRESASIIRIPPNGIPLEDIERMAIVEALKMSNWVQKDAAEMLAISPRVMNYKIKVMGIELPRGRQAHAPVDSAMQASA